ncbi:hypothetical protein HDU86_005376 [Geranomyces michiganensis]|nr:hypothetical protein HDU86_005376 [Geranomyces michiganensis]
MAIHGISALGLSLFSQYWRGQKEHLYLERIGFEFITFGSRDFFYGPNVYANNFLASTTMTPVMTNALISKSITLGLKVNRHVIVDKIDPDTGAHFKVALVAYVWSKFCELTQCADPAGSEPRIQIQDAITGLASYLQELIFVEQPDVVVAISSGTDFDYDIQVAQTVPGINVILASDSHVTVSDDTPPTTVTGPTGGTVLLVNDYHKLGVHALTSLRMSYTDGKPTWWTATNNPVNTCENDATTPSGCITPDASVGSDANADNVLPVQSKAEVAGVLNSKLDGLNNVCRRGECTVGSMVADAMLWKMAGQCDAALINGGMVRKDLPAGSVTLGNLLEALPNSNTVSITKLRGADIFDAFRQGFYPIDPEPGTTGKYPQVAQLRVTYNSNNTISNRLVDITIYNATLDTYVKMDPDHVYNLCTNDFMLGGGDGYGILLSQSLGTFRQGPVMDVLVKDFMVAHNPYSLPVGGRLTDLFKTTGTSSPPLVGTCIATATAATASGSLEDACDGGYRHSTSQTWVITPPSAQSIYTTFSGNFTMDPATDTLYLSDTATGLPVLVPPMFGHSDLVAANFTVLPTAAVGVPNLASLTIKLVANRPITGAGIKISYTSDAGCPGGYLLTGGKCVPCAAGTYAAKDAAACTPCAPGTIAYSRGMSSCVQCESGTFLTTSGGTECKACDGGRVSVSPTQCTCPSGKDYNGILCVESQKSEAGPIAGIAVGVIVAGAGAAFYAYRRRMAAIKRRHLGIQKHKKIKADVAMVRILQDVAHAAVQIGLDLGECFLDWHAFLEVSSDDRYRLAFIASCIFQSLITLLSAAIRVYNMVMLLRIRTQGVKLIAAGAKITSVEALARIQDAQNDADLHMVLLNLRTLKQKVIITIAVAIPGVLKSLPMLIVNALVAREQTSAGLTLLLAFGFNCLVFAVNIQETLGWFSLKHHYTKQKTLADAKLKDLGLKRPDAATRGIPSSIHQSSHAQSGQVQSTHKDGGGGEQLAAASAPQVILKTASVAGGGGGGDGGVVGIYDSDEVSDEENRGNFRRG